MSNLSQNTIDLRAILDAVNSLPEAAGGSGGGSGETCTVTIIVPADVRVFGYGRHDVYTSTNNGQTWVPLGVNAYVPSSGGMTHRLPFMSKRVFSAIPVGSIFTFYYPDYISGATASDTIVFSLANDNISAITNYMFAVCRCDGDGEITIVV